MQSLFAYYISDGTSTTAQSLRELEKNIQDFYRLFLHLISFLKELYDFIEEYDHESRTVYIPSAQKIQPNKKFYDGIIARKIRQDKNLAQLIEKEKIFWQPDDKDLFRKVFNDLKNNENYQDYINSENEEIWEEFDIISFVLKHYPQNFGALAQYFEAEYLNWYDDSKTAIQQAVKTIKKCVSENEDMALIIPESPMKDEDNMEFARDLLRKVIENDMELDSYITGKIEKWEPSRIMLIDRIILKMGIAEFLYFPLIPTKVTINECIELSKNYSSPQSRKFINGVLDNLLNMFKQQGKINKTGIGLLE